MNYTVTFRNVSLGIQSTITLYSHYTSIYGNNSGEGKTHFIEMVKQGMSVGDISVDVQPKGRFAIADASFLDALLSNTNELLVILIDELSMLRSEKIKEINKSSHLFIAVSRGIPLKLDYPMYGIYNIKRFSNDNGACFEIVRADQLRLYSDKNSRSLEFDNIVTESSFGRSEHDLLSSYLFNLIPAYGRDNIHKHLMSDNSILVMSDLSAIGKAYGLLLKRCKNSKNIYFYPYNCFEELLLQSQLVAKSRKDTPRVSKSKFNFISIERYMEYKLEIATKNTPLEYTHGKPLPSAYKDKANFEKVFNSKVGKLLYDYIKNKRRGVI